MTGFGLPLFLEQLRSAETLTTIALTLVGALAGMLGPVLVMNVAQSRIGSNSDPASDEPDPDTDGPKVEDRAVHDADTDNGSKTPAYRDIECELDIEGETSGTAGCDADSSDPEREDDLADGNRIDLSGLLDLGDQCGTDPAAESSPESDIDEADIPDPTDEADTADPAVCQRERLAPASIEWETRAARLDDEWVSTLYVAGYPDYPSDGYLGGLFELTDVEFDLTADLKPKNQRRARDELQNEADDLQAEADLERTVRGSYLQERANEATAT
ncbi:MAG: hypothetical protein V5A27_13150, partial [Halapricum sp.]